MSKISNFEDLFCWQKAMKLTVDIYKISSHGELKKDFGLRDQLQKSAVSIASNIAEGKERESIAEFIRFFYIAKGSAGELRTQLILAKNIGYLHENDFNILFEQVKKISMQIGSLIKSLKKKK